MESNSIEESAGPAPITVHYLVSMTLQPGLEANHSPAEDAVLGALEVGTEGAPEDLGFAGVQAISVQSHTPAANKEIEVGESSILALIDTYEDALTTHIYDEDNNEKVPDEDRQLVANARMEFDGMRELTNNLATAAKGALQLWDDLYSNMARQGEDDGEIKMFEDLRAAIATVEEANRE